MLVLRLVAALTVAIVVADARLSVAQVPPETSAYEIVDLVPPPSPVTCTCVSGAFALPVYRPGHGWGGGPATPAEHRPLDTGFAARMAEDRAALPTMAEQGLAGSGDASLLVSMHVRESSLAVGVDKRAEEEASRWLHLAALQEHPDAFRLLGYRYQRGEAVPQSDEAAAYWFQQGARRGDKLSMMALGLRYANGRGVPQDFAAAVYWWKQAQDHPIAARFLGDAYACGLGVDQDPNRAVREYKRSGDVTGDIQLGRLYLGGCAPPNDEAAVAVFKRAAGEGFPEAQRALSELFLHGKGVEASAPQAYFWARMAERPLRPGEAHGPASPVAKAAAARMSAEERAAAEMLVQSMIEAAMKRDQ